MNANSTVPGAAAAEKIAVFTAGRFQPPTPGHLALLEKVVEEAKKRGGDAFVFPSYSVEGYKGPSIIKNPLSYESKIKYLEKIIENANLKITTVKRDDCNAEPFTQECNNALTGITYLKKNGYTKLFLVLGSDRADQPQFQFKNNPNIKVISIVRNENSNDPIIGISGSKIRNAIVKNDTHFIAEIYKNKLSLENQANLMKEIKESIQTIKENQKTNKIQRLLKIGNTRRIITQKKPTFIKSTKTKTRRYTRTKKPVSKPKE